jgi:hypothetical protein
MKKPKQKTIIVQSRCPNPGYYSDEDLAYLRQLEAECNEGANDAELLPDGCNVPVIPLFNPEQWYAKTLTK